MKSFLEVSPQCIHKRHNIKSVPLIAGNIEIQLKTVHYEVTVDLYLKFYQTFRHKMIAGVCKVIAQI
eukprot:9732904-Karenia_brevis.AAC.1